MLATLCKMKIKYRFFCVENTIFWTLEYSFILLLLVPPMIRIQKQMKGMSVGSTVTLDCYVEAYPTPVTYWEESDATLLEPYNFQVWFCSHRDGLFHGKSRKFRKFHTQFVKISARNDFKYDKRGSWRFGTVSLCEQKWARHYQSRFHTLW